MPPRKKGKVQMSIFFDVDLSEVLKKYVKYNTTLSVSTWVNNVVKQELIGLGEMIDTDADTIAELVSKNYDILVKETEIPKAILDQVKRGAKPDEITLLRIHGALHIPEVELKAMLKNIPDESRQLNLTLQKTSKGARKT